MKKSQTNNIKDKKGFSILETIIAAFVLSIGILTVVGLISSSLKNSMDSRNQIIASELVQEGIELARNVRDGNFITGSSDSFTGFPASNLADCRVSKLDFSPKIDCGSGDKRMIYANGYYIHNGQDSSGTSTQFFRRITFQYFKSDGSAAANPTDPATVSATITSMVSWNGSIPSTNTALCNAARKCVYTQLVLTKWK